MIIWIASYPKSGNTWLRSFISSYYFSKKGKFSFEIFDKNRFYRKFLVSRKNQKDIDKVYFGLIYNLSKFDAKIFFISLDEDNQDLNDNLDNLIYSFNNKSITINNWISLRSFINKILSGEIV